MEKETISLDKFKQQVQCLYEENVDNRTLINFIYDAHNLNLTDFEFDYVTEKETKAEDASGYWTEFIFKRKSDNKYFSIDCYDCEEIDGDLCEVEMKIKMIYTWEY